MADLVVDNKINLKLKSVTQLTPVMEAQLINYLKLSGIQAGYLINFNGLRMVYKRFVCTSLRC
ncbi:MAG: GxxExxY protein [Spirochaetales bacterium]|nr:GxxExxY protein [Spirochaetales bacterium]